MAFRAIRMVVLLSILPAAGCGTVTNLARQCPGETGVVPFGGVKHDLRCMRGAANGEFVLKGHSGSEADPDPRAALVLLSAADLPFSLIGDIVTWPYAAAYAWANQPNPVPPVVYADPSVPQPLQLPIPPTTSSTPPATLPIPPLPQPTPPATQTAPAPTAR